MVNILVASTRQLKRLKVQRERAEFSENKRMSYYIAGPPAMIQTLTENLLKKDIAPEMIKVDAWE